MFIGTSGFIEEGAMVRQRQELIRLPDFSRVLAEVKIHESRVRQIRPGMSAYVRVETLPGRHFKGTVRRVAILPDAQASWMNAETKVYATDVLIDEELPELKPGVSARVEIVITNLSKVLSVPIQAVTTFNGDQVCFVRRGSAVAPVPVTTGWFNDRFIEVISGLKEGDRVLLAPVGDPEHLEPQSPEGETNEVLSSRSDAVPPRNGPPSGEENGTVEQGSTRPEASQARPPRRDPGIERGENQPSDSQGAADGARARRRRVQADP
jgi:HlyD family secretion protein